MPNEIAQNDHTSMGAIELPLLSEERRAVLYEALAIEILPMLRDLCAAGDSSGQKQLRMATQPCPFGLLLKKGTELGSPCAYKNCIHYEKYQNGIPASLIKCLPCDHYDASCSNFQMKSEAGTDVRVIIRGF